MVFSSLTFLFVFLPTALGLYYLVPRRMTNVVLWVFSLFFYAWGEPLYVLLMFATIAVEYLLTRWMDNASTGTLRRGICAIALIFALGLLGFFKYADFIVSNLNALGLGIALPLRHLALPVGISFYTFQLVSYVIDVYRKEVPAQRSFLVLGTYICMFPQLVAGPIVRYETLREQLECPGKRTYAFCSGARRLVLGLAKKVLLANVLGELAAKINALEKSSTLSFWLLAVTFTLQLYLDFSAYSDMAIGLGKLMGFDFEENFNYPLISQSITEFWRRWHISLGTWFRDYVYIPLGGSRVSRGRRIINLLIVWFLSGLWHGAAWTFVAWGLYQFVLIVLEKGLFGRLLEKAPRAVRHTYLLVATLIGFTLFNAEHFAVFAARIKGMFVFSVYPLLTPYTRFLLRDYGVILIIAALAATPLPAKIARKIASFFSEHGARTPDESPKEHTSNVRPKCTCRTGSFSSQPKEHTINTRLKLKYRTRSSSSQSKENAHNLRLKHVFALLQTVYVVALLALSAAHLIDGSFNPFLYFRF
jgi:alginate O-acetyltransferase complex protein AlgI